MALRLVLLMVLALAATGHALAERRVALVVGNSAYRHVAVLDNPSRDAAAIAAALRRLGFEVIEGTDLDRRGLLEVLHRFARTIRGADAAVFYYAGHGLQVDGHNYIAPVDAKLTDETDVEFELVDLDSVLGQMERERRVNLVILDSCRDNPMATTLARSMGTRSAGATRGLARVESGVGTMIAFATQPGNVALDGSGDHSPFTKALLDHIETPGLDVAVLMREVRGDVMKATGDRQVPWTSSSLTGAFAFAERAPDSTLSGAAPSSSTDATPAPTDESALDLAFWRSVQDSTDKADFELYLKHFPHGVFADLATQRIRRLDGQRVAAADPTDAATAEPAPAPAPAPAPSGGRGVIGVSIRSVTGDIAKSVGLDAPDGALVTKVVEGGAAAAAGVKLGDVILDYDGEAVADAPALAKLAREAVTGVEISVVILRQGRRITLSITPHAAEHSATDGAAKAASAAPATARRYGLTLAQIDPDIRARYHIAAKVSGMVVIGVDPAGQNAAKDVRVGDVVVRIADTAVPSLADFDRAVAAERSDLLDGVMALVADKSGTLRVILLSADIN